MTVICTTIRRLTFNDARRRVSADYWAASTRCCRMLLTLWPLVLGVNSIPTRVKSKVSLTQQLSTLNSTIKDKIKQYSQ